MTDPYAVLREQLVAAARRLESPAAAHGRLRTWLSRHVNAWVLALAALLSGGAVALAASGVLSGSPVAPEPVPTATSGNGVPVAAATLPPAITVADPAGGLPWGARIFHTTRGQLCIQVGRLRSGELGELGLDSAFGDDGRFHALPVNALPPGYGGSASQVECVPAGRTVIFEDANADRSGARLLPEEFDSPPGAKHRKIPAGADLRTLAYGLLGPHAVSITYRTPAGLRTIPVTGREGAFLVVEPAGYVRSPSLVGGSIVGAAGSNSVLVLGPGRSAIVTAATFRFGTELCSQGEGAPVRTRCPQRHSSPPRRWYQPTRSLRQPVHLTLLTQPASACRRAFLLTPCYRGEVSFTAPYAVKNAVADYTIETISRCSVGGRPETGWSLERNLAAHQPVRAVSPGLFVFTPSCAPSESFEILYLNPGGPSRAAPHESAVVGTVSMGRATLPGGARPIGPRSR